MELMIRPLRRYADFSGRSRRTEYWLFALFQLAVYIAVFIIAAVIIAVSGMGDPSNLGRDPFADDSKILFAYIPIGLVWLFFLVPSTAVQVRRYHDQNMSGWLALLNLPYYIPLLGYLFALVIILMMCLPGTNGPNQYGEDPKSPADSPYGLRGVFE